MNERDSEEVLGMLAAQGYEVVGRPEGSIPVPMGMTVYPTDGTHIEELFTQATHSLSSHNVTGA